MVGVADPRLMGFDLGSSASVLNARAAMTAEVQEEQKAAWEKIPERQRERMIQVVKMTMARKAIMSGPHATPPRPNTLMRFIRQIERGTPMDKAYYLTMDNGKYLHPTKGWRGLVAKKA